MAGQWHPHRNGELAPTRGTAHSSKEVWWLCTQGHADEDSVANRSKGMVYQYCPCSRRSRRAF
ncbi:zinc-ribbon domain-containing protein [Streptomyces sp. bgisy031]|uniref:zinc-ribbon domain-containing protein n=1 Tax=Streptomyces sp. bgisy031 TaxID=3413772 RepID=UPI003D713910